MLLSVRRSLTALLFLLVCLVSRADYIVQFSPVDSLTRLDLRKCETLVFLPGDSVLVTEGHFMNSHVQGDIKTQRHMTIYLPEKDVEYQIVIDAEGYNTRTFNYKVDKATTEYQFTRLGEIGVLRTPKQLNEVTVEATKIKMYYKGDTLIYNADAFLLPDGSMLDDLIRKLDGVRIDEYGQIFCNGRKVRSLQLQGRQLFDGNPKTLLENLGAYTVSKIKVYDYVSDREKFLGYDEEGHGGERELVMDVNLKKEYSIGKWVNIDAGYGTENRYLGRGFMLGFTQKWAFSGYVNANNLAASDNPEQHTSWRMGKAGTDEATYLNGGVSYQNDWRQGQRYRKIKGTVSVASSRTTDRGGEERVNYLSTGDTYETHYQNSRNRSFRLSTNHRIDMQPSQTVYFNASPSFSYSSAHNDSHGYSITMNEYLGRVTAEEIEAIYSRDPEQMARHVINRHLTQSKDESDRWNFGLSASTTLRLPDLGSDGSLKQNLTVNASGNYDRQTPTAFSLSTINYGDDPTPANQYYAYTRRHPNHEYGINGSANYTLNIKGQGQVQLNYTYNRGAGRSTYARYMLNELSERDLGFGDLPVNEEELAAVLDLHNSSESRRWSNNHQINLNTSAHFGERDLDKGGRGSIYFAVNPSLRVFDANLHYTRHAYDTIASRTSVLPGVNAFLNFYRDHGNRKINNSLSFHWRSSASPVDLSRLINLSNTTDPLYITQGNPNLRNSYYHVGSAEYHFQKSTGKWHDVRIKYEYNFNTNSVVNGMNYNPLTGVRISRPYNVNGNRNQSLRVNGYTQILKYQGGWFNFMNFDYDIRLNDQRSVSMVSSWSGGFQPPTSEEVLEPQRSYVYRKEFRPSGSLTFNFKNFDFRLGVNGGWSRYTGQEAYYNAFTAANLNYTFSTNIRLPKNITLNTNLTVYTRSGYRDPALNTTEYIWNASASWHWKKANLTFSADAYDLLHQISRISYYADQMGRTERWSNTIPRYALLRIRYHLDLNPK